MNNNDFSLSTVDRSNYRFLRCKMNKKFKCGQRDEGGTKFSCNSSSSLVELDLF